MAETKQLRGQPTPTADLASSNTRMELPPEAYVLGGGKSPFALRNNKFNTEGTSDMVYVNQYRVKKVDFTKKVYQYDVTVSPDDRKLPMNKILESSEIKDALSRYNYPTWIFDGRKMAWAPALVDRGECRVKVDLDKDRRPPGGSIKPGSVFHVTLRRTTEIDLSVLQGYLESKVEFTNKVVESLNFMDHLLRQGPSGKFSTIKRSFYDPDQKGRPLGDGRLIDVHKGLYASIRLSHNLAQGGVGLALNCDVANTSFWVGNQSMDQLVCHFLASCDGLFCNLDPATTLGYHLRPVQRRDGQFQSTEAFKTLRKLRRLKFNVRHANRKNPEKVFTVEDFMFGPEYCPEGCTATNVNFDHEGKQTSVFDYYRKKYGVTLRYPKLPLIDAGKGGAVPMELAFILPMQRYMFKLSGKHTDAMIKIAVTKPAERRRDIEQRVKGLDLQNDRHLRFYGVEFDANFAQTKAKILAPPIVNFKQGRQEPRFAGRWRLDQGNIRFWKPNQRPLVAWGIIAMDNCLPGPGAMTAFVNKFRTTFIRHGGSCPEPGMVLSVPGASKANGAEAVEFAHNQIRRARGYTQLLFIVVGFKNSPHYERLKKNADCRFGILSQIVTHANVGNDAGNSQYISNVCMKVNAKLGGSTSRTATPFGKSPTYFPPNRPTMQIGMDVSHAAPGANSPSVAAMTMNCDADANRFAAAVESNSYRMETVHPANLHMFLDLLYAVWCKGHNGATPGHVMYFRDGVAEGQFAQVIDREVDEMKRWFRSRKKAMPKFTVIVATKRHHIRFFPGPDQRTKGGDQNLNPKPGLLVEHEVTHPFMWDFYLNSHKAIQGTARPIHYYVILDEMNCPVNDLQRIIYHQCYSYVRSTTPVSIHPAIYYAHLACNRARQHENISIYEGFRSGGKGHEFVRNRVSKGQEFEEIPQGTEAPTLLEVGGRIPPTGMAPDEIAQREFIKETMWYI
ncbi:eukaryotic translation initiation factor 2C [Geosmithia morbida]|uniref:Eukaryotic translation initiation factor 2C n=1 Tax=Geosmithia morbida TaxID=1094350 RepID=A0A9P4Z267_9HYPO|nr:eukaryotic translation initiation factor 2C [Geosmithia morbida]KAF4126056.1 eukaryotic translation initiation factor 2C [Geosmithia morbida]